MNELDEQLEAEILHAIRDESLSQRSDEEPGAWESRAAARVKALMPASALRRRPFPQWHLQGLQTAAYALERPSCVASNYEKNANWRRYRLTTEEQAALAYAASLVLEQHGLQPKPPTAKSAEPDR